MKSRIYQIQNDASEFKVAFFGCNLIDLFYNGLEGFRRLAYKKNPNRPEPLIPDYPLVHETINVTGKSYELMYADWMRELLKIVQTHHLLPLSLDFINVSDKEISTQSTLRRATKRDKLNVPIKDVVHQPAKLEKIKSGYQIIVTFDV